MNGLLDILTLMGLCQKAIPQPHMWLGERLNAEIVISAVDSMAVRRQLFSACVREGKTRLFIDARTGGEYMKVYALDPANDRMKHNYLATLHSDDSADNVPCTASQIIYTSLFAGGMIAHRVKQWIRSEEIAFDTIFDIQHEVVVPSRRLWKRA